MLHEVGAHYTYARVPYDEWTIGLFGFSLDQALGFERNHFDRFVHFCYGLLFAYPIREVFIRIADVKGFLGYFLPLDVTMSTFHNVRVDRVGPGQTAHQVSSAMCM
jgi:putative membrane protein